MTAFQKYNLAFFLIFVLCTGVFSFLSLDMQPYSGDLTRIGGYREADYGWNEPKEVFVEPMFRYATEWSDYNHHYDVVVIGDSFSKDVEHGWQNFLSMTTGLSVITFHVDRFRIEDLVQNPVYKSDPPMLVIFESVERVALARFARDSELDVPIEKKTLNPNVKMLAPKPAKVVAKSRLIDADFLEKLNLASNYFSKAFFREVLHLNFTKVTSIEVNAAYFSTKKSNEFLFLKTHLDPNTLSLTKLGEAKKGLSKIKAAVEGNGKTYFQLMIFPNKLSVYRGVLQNSSIKVKSLFDYSEEFSTFNLLPVYELLQQHVNDHVIDLYLPNDTHVSSKGYEYVAELVVKNLKEAGRVAQ